ncbi:MAG: hypothetical protein HZC02_03265 [Candidatus Levybacteria bacterium]|nr:hypothetical protein [Candidatus Levybacteria bacterium]
MGSAISTPREWRDDSDFTAARNAYVVDAGRSYSSAVSSGVSASSLLAATITTTSRHPIIVVIDVTGSMQEWPATIRGKLPLLDTYARQIYFDDDAQILFMAVGDATCDKYPLQGHAFAQGADLKAELDPTRLKYEGGGGPKTTESYELAALYVSHNVSMPNATRPLIIFLGDESPYDEVSPKLAQQFAKVTTERITTAELFAKLNKDSDVYFIQKPYSHSTADSLQSLDPESSAIHADWVKLLGEDHIAILRDPNRVVDVILGIFAKKTGKVDFYHDEINERQKPGQVEAAYRSLKTILAVSPGDPRDHSGKSIMLLEDEDAKPVSRPF